MLLQLDKDVQKDHRVYVIPIKALEEQQVSSGVMSCIPEKPEKCLFVKSPPLHLLLAAYPFFASLFSSNVLSVSSYLIQFTCVH